MNEQPPQDSIEGASVEVSGIVLEAQETETDEEQGARGLAEWQVYEARIAAEAALIPERDETEEQRERAIFLEERLHQFEEEFNLDELFAIVTKEEAEASPAREKAKVDLFIIAKQLKLLKVGDAVTQVQYDEINRRYRNAFHAVGRINSGVVFHD